DVVGQAPLVVVGVDGRTTVGVFGTLVADGDGQPLVEEGHLLHPAGQRLVGERGGLENAGIGPEGDLGSGLLGRLTLDEVAGRRGRFVVLAPHVSVAANLHVQVFGQRVDDGDTDTVQTTRDGVRLVVELATGVQRGQDQLHCGSLLHGGDVDRDASAVVGHPYAAIGQQGHFDGVGVACHRLVDRVVDHLSDQVVQAPLSGGTDVHPGALAYCFKPLEDRD